MSWTTTIGYMNQLGYVHCVACAIGAPPERFPHPSWEPMQVHNLVSLDDECDGCHRRLVPTPCLVCGAPVVGKQGHDEGCMVAAS